MTLPTFAECAAVPPGKRTALQELIYYTCACVLEEGEFIEKLTAVIEEERKERDALLAEVQSLQRALAFWMPRIPAGESPAIDRLANDAWLLSGYEGEDEPDAESMGWVVLNTIAKEPTT